MEVEVIKANNNFDDSSSVNRKERLRVAAYCRVSTSDEEQAKSYDSMVKYYTDLIKKNPDWAFVDVYADKASTGTKAETREDFQRLIADCLAGKIDMVIAKSLSRFARNTLSVFYRIYLFHFEIDCNLSLTKHANILKCVECISCES